MNSIHILTVELACILAMSIFIMSGESSEIYCRATVFPFSLWSLNSFLASSFSFIIPERISLLNSALKEWKHESEEIGNRYWAESGIVEKLWYDWMIWTFDILLMISTLNSTFSIGSFTRFLWFSSEM